MVMPSLPHLSVLFHRLLADRLMKVVASHTAGACIPPTSLKRRCRLPMVWPQDHRTTVIWLQQPSHASPSVWYLANTRLPGKTRRKQHRCSTGPTEPVVITVSRRRCGVCHWQKRAGRLWIVPTATFWLSGCSSTQASLMGRSPGGSVA